MAASKQNWHSGSSWKASLPRHLEAVTHSLEAVDRISHNINTSVETEGGWGNRAWDIFKCYVWSIAGTAAPSCRPRLIYFRNEICGSFVYQPQMKFGVEVGSWGGGKNFMGNGRRGGVLVGKFPCRKFGLSAATFIKHCSWRLALKMAMQLLAETLGYRRHTRRVPES
jgi:hypothetical protein